LDSLSKVICEFFPNEEAATYYIKATGLNNSKTTYFGKLWHGYYNKHRRGLTSGLKSSSREQVENDDVAGKLNERGESTSNPDDIDECGIFPLGGCYSPKN